RSPPTTRSRRSGRATYPCTEKCFFGPPGSIRTRSASPAQTTRTASSAETGPSEAALAGGSGVVAATSARGVGGAGGLAGFVADFVAAFADAARGALPPLWLVGSRGCVAAHAATRSAVLHANGFGAARPRRIGIERMLSRTRSEERRGGTQGRPVPAPYSRNDKRCQSRS